MIGVTLFGLFLTPVFYVALRTLVERGHRESQASSQSMGGEYRA